MKKMFSIPLYVMIIFSLLGCSMDVSQPATATPYSEVASPATSTNDPTSASNLPWAGMHLSGHLVYNAVSQNGDERTISMQVLDLTNGETRTIFTTTSYVWIYYATVSPDGRQVVMSYVPPPKPDSESETTLYVMPLDGSAQPRPLLIPPTIYDQYLQVEWSPDGNYLYFVQYNYHDQPTDQVFPNYEIFRMAYPDGQPEKVMENAFWPRISPDSSKIVYVSMDPATGMNELFLANIDGSNPKKIVLSGSSVPKIIDAPIFSPDGKSILFSAPALAQSYLPSWFDKLMGVQIVKAHYVPSDWWSVPVTGGTPTQLTHIQSAGLFGSISPDQKHVVSLSENGLFVMDLDGSNLTLLIPDPAGSTINWIP